MGKVERFFTVIFLSFCTVLFSPLILFFWIVQISWATAMDVTIKVSNLTRED